MKEERAGAKKNTLAKMKRSQTVNSKEVITNTYETVELTKKLFRFDRIMAKARKYFGNRITREQFDELEEKRKQINEAFEAYFECGVRLKLDKKV